MDIALVSIPRMNIDAPPMGISVIKSSLEKRGKTVKCFDTNIALYHRCTFDEWLELDAYFQTDLRYTNSDKTGTGNRIIDFRAIINNRKDTLKCSEKYRDFIKEQLTDILSYSPEWIGFSIFSVNSVIPAIDYLTELRNLSPNTKVMVGGMGLSTSGLGGSANFGEYLLKENLVDSVVVGEGEEVVNDVIEEETPMVTAPQIRHLDNLPFPAYDDFDFGLYPGEENMVYITGSRGCVRRCTFCDINGLWERFRFRSGESLAQEIYNGYTKHGTTDFYFTDSLINGNKREFIRLLDEVIKLKKEKKIPEEVMFGGQFIAKPKSRFPEENYRKMKEAGVYNISVGLESGSDSVLKDMRKGTTREDHDFMMEMLQKYDIRINLLMLFGYPTETENDFKQTLKLLKDYKKYSDSGIIWGVVLGKTMVVLPNTPIADNTSHWGITYDDNGNWVSTDNPTLTYHERVKRRMEAGRLCEKLGYVIKSQVVTVNSLHEIVNRGGYDTI